MAGRSDIAFKNLPPLSGRPYINAQGTRAIKNGVSVKRASDPGARKPRWSMARAPSGERFEEMLALTESGSLSTVCREARCPNIGECWNAGVATFMLMGSTCTRACRFCAVDTGSPKQWLNVTEPLKIAHAVERLRLSYVVLTSVNRDDLHDGGAAHFAATIRAIRALPNTPEVEALTPDFAGDFSAIRTVVEAGAHVFAQNLETVRRMTPLVRDGRAGYDQTLTILAKAASTWPGLIVKSSLMVGLGETDEEIDTAMKDLRAANVRVLTIGQYLRPTRNHLPVDRYVSPDEFEKLRHRALDLGFVDCAAGPLVRSSYRADRAAQRVADFLRGAE